ncbi:proline/betaine ABC transporter permease ProW, partial [Salmonella enterica subsp. enterica serovar Weltevreden]|nr:proline/betaine ABC transporter permease ProW [Salmonella enterica subsp. enterica serovar Weltevreden]
GATGPSSPAHTPPARGLTALDVSDVIGRPLGTGLARSPRAANIVRPLLDAMPTTRACVYLVPIVRVFGLGNVPGVVGTIICAL